MNTTMVRMVVIGVCLSVGLVSCATYNTNKGRRNPPQAPVSAHPPLQQLPQLSLEHTQLDSVPKIITPIVKTVWIMPHQTTSGDFVGAYPLHIVIRHGDVVVQPDALVTRPPLPAIEHGDPLITPPATQQERSQYTLPEEGGLDPPLGQFRERPVYPVPEGSPATGRQSQQDPSEIMVEQAKKAAEHLRQQMSGAGDTPTVTPVSPEIDR